MTVTLCLSRSLVLLNRRPRAHSSGPKGPFGLMWLSLPHFVNNSVRSSTQLPLPMPTALAHRTQLNYIIVRHPLDLWNQIFNRHQAEITVMQCRGHSLPVHHSVVYHGNYLAPFHRPISAYTISSPNCHWSVSLPSGASPWNNIFGGRGWFEGQNITCRLNIYPPNECPVYDNKHDGEVPVIPGRWGMKSNPSLPLLLVPLWPGVVAHDRALSMGKL